MDRSLPPTARRLALARRAGVVLTSPAVIGAVALVAVVAATTAALGGVAATLAADGRAAWQHAAEDGAIARALATRPGAVTATALGLAWPLALAAAGAALVATAVLARGLVVPRRAVTGAPGPADDASARGVDALLGLVRVGALAALAGAFVVDRLPALAGLAGRGPTTVATATGALALSALGYVALGAIVTSGLELAVRAARHRAALRMTAREARDERKDGEADPTLRRRLRARAGDARAQLDRALALFVDGERAVALGWRRGQPPTVVALGAGITARALASAARLRRLPIVPMAPTLAALTRPGAVPVAAQPSVAATLTALGLGPR